MPFIGEWNQAMHGMLVFTSILFNALSRPAREVKVVPAAERTRTRYVAEMMLGNWGGRAELPRQAR